ncbi:branched-chain amino acid ABC transporter permease [Actinophytocola sp.]|jgi:branched-chain amino acid transport system permease protein|uniref:branched-chain amino acid ABC transporter permease n=1 Tax=Actinophytocola sp. TaxID=1872138 RepID=UPI002D22751E|nr:branched-chain amino acid ABC transporter permease [Actinophytocola sp.]HYQ67564.1 branched-chain amino acid ABC transporter permease [Actinophytocola sp.]
MNVVQATLSGALIGGLYALMAIGLSVTWGVLRVINLAHFGLILIGAYLTFQLTTSWGIDPLLTLVVTVPAMFVAGAVLQWVFDRLALAEFNSLLVSFGLLIITIQVASNVWSADFQRMDAAVNPYATESVSIGRLVFPVTTLLAFVLAGLVVLGAHLVLRRTFAGRALRAIAQDRAVAGAFGVDHRKLSLLLGGAVGATAALAGAVFSLSNALTPETAYEWFGIVFAVVILGGIGEVVGTFAAGVLVGVLSGVVSVVWSPATAPFVLFSAIILALLLRPRGLFAMGAVR